MCQLLGFTANKSYSINNLLKAFFADSVKHPHGWGIALITDNKFDLIKEPVAAHQSEKVVELCNSPLYTNLAIAHIRYMTRGIQEFVNTHPFIKSARNTDWVLAHNGTITYPFYFSGYKNKPIGSTDSEKILCFLSEKLKSSKFKDIKVIENNLSLLSKFGKLNILLSDGQNLYVYTNRVGTLFQLKFNNCTLFATKPICTTNNMSWSQVPLNRLLVYKDGEEIYKSNEFTSYSTWSNKLGT